MTNCTLSLLAAGFVPGWWLHGDQGSEPRLQARTSDPSLCLHPDLEAHICQMVGTPEQSRNVSPFPMLEEAQSLRARASVTWR